MTRIQWAPSQSKRFDPPRFRNLRLANEQRNPWRVNLRNLATFSTTPAGYSLPRTRSRGYPRFEWIRDRASVVPEKKRTAGKRVFLPSLPSKLKGKRRERESGQTVGIAFEIIPSEVTWPIQASRDDRSLGWRSWNEFFYIFCYGIRIEYRLKLLFNPFRYSHYCLIKLQADSIIILVDSSQYQDSIQHWSWRFYLYSWKTANKLGLNYSLCTP